MKEKPYFKHDHDSRHDPRIMKIRKKYGCLGYGIYFMLIEMLRSACKYTIKLDIENIAFDVKAEEKIIEDIIKNYGLFRINKGSFYSPSLKDRMKALDNIRKGWVKGGKRRWEKNDNEKSIYREFKG